MSLLRVDINFARKITTFFSYMQINYRKSARKDAFSVIEHVFYSCIKSCITTLAEYATGVPGPKMAATPALYKKS